MLEQAERVAQAARGWLQCDEPTGRIRILVFTPDQAQGRYWLNRDKSRHPCAGVFLGKERLLVLVGHWDDPRFWDVLRHEAAHTALFRPDQGDFSVPFWLNEGAACLFETGLDASGRPLPNPQRLELARYLAKTHSSLHLKSMIRQARPAVPDGAAYARAWAICAYLYQSRRSPGPYLRRLGCDDTNLLSLFEETLLEPDETFAEFEKKVARFFVSE